MASSRILTEPVKSVIALRSVASCRDFLALLGVRPYCVMYGEERIQRASVNQAMAGHEQGTILWVIRVVLGEMVYGRYHTGQYTIWHSSIIKLVVELQL
jgi:hypothetical protein